MSRNRFVAGFVATCIFAIAAPSSPAQTIPGGDSRAADAESFPFLRDFFEYDTGVPLEVHVVARVEEPTYVREKVVFRGPRDRRVPCDLAIPQGGAAPHACVLLIHGIGGSRADWWNEDSFHSGATVTKALLSAGIAVMTIDAVYHGERSAGNDYESPEVFLFQDAWFYRARDMIVDSVVEHRRAMDYLASRPGIDSTRIGAIGYSMGGMMVVQLAAVDPRIRAAVVCVPPLLKDEHSALTIRNFAPHVRDIPLLMLIGSDDTRNYTVEDARALFDLVGSSDKEFVVFESEHRLPGEWTERASRWMTDNLP